MINFTYGAILIFNTLKIGKPNNLNVLQSNKTKGPVILNIHNIICLPNPYFIANGDLKMGPSCFGSPAKTSCPHPPETCGSTFRIPATQIRSSGSIACPASSTITWLKCPTGKLAEANLKRTSVFKEYCQYIVIQTNNRNTDLFYIKSLTFSSFYSTDYFLLFIED